MSTIFEHGYALIVGVDANQIPRLALPAVAKDVQAVYDVLVHPDRCAYNPDNVKFLKEDQSTRENILDGLYWLQGKVKGDAQATAVIYYSGHGMVDKATDQYYLIPYNISELSRIRHFALKAEDLTAEISDVQAKRMLAILDCCHAAGMDVKDINVAVIDSGPAVEAAPFPLDLPQTKNIPSFDTEPGAKNVSDLLDGEGRAVLNSSTGSQSSYVRTDGAMSLFTYHLIEALTGHAPHPDDATVVYVTDVMSWVAHQVKKSAREQNRDQTPVMRTSGVFPIAQLIGGQGVAKGMGQLPPSPLDPLPVTNQAEGSIVSGSVDTGGGDFAGRDMVKKEGGVHIDGGFNMSGGSFVGGDSKVVQGDEVYGDKVGGDKVGGSKISVGNISGSSGVAIGPGASANVNTGDTFNMSGDFRGAILNIKSTLSNVQQTVGSLPTANDADKKELQNLIGQLEQALTRVPEAYDEDAEAVSQTTEAFVNMAAGEKPNKTMLQITGEGLKQAAKNLAAITPDVLTIATSIVGTVLKLTGIG